MKHYLKEKKDFLLNYVHPQNLQYFEITETNMSEEIKIAVKHKNPKTLKFYGPLKSNLYV